jgi:hypothetical protein
VKFENKSARGLQGDVIEEPDVNIGRLLEVRALGVTRSGATATIAMLEESNRRWGLPPDPTFAPIAEGQTNY